MTKSGVGTTTEDSLKVKANRGEQRRRAMMDATWELMLEKGISGFSLADVITRSGGSRATLYNAFGDKEGLLKAVMIQGCNEAQDELQMTLRSELPPKQALTEFGLTLASWYFGGDGCARFVQLMFTEAMQYPFFLDTFLQNGPDVTLRQLTYYLQQKSDEGLLAIHCAKRSATMFMGLILGDWVRQIEQLVKPVTWQPQQLQTHVDDAVRIFLNGLATEQYRLVSS